VLPAAASAQAATHTLRFASVLKTFVVCTKTTVAEQDTHVTSASKPSGSTSYKPQRQGRRPERAHGPAEHSRLLWETLTLSHNGAYAHGTFTGGTGTITAKPANKTGTHPAVTITYTS
jgi:hypothetical protein